MLRRPQWTEDGGQFVWIGVQELVYLLDKEMVFESLDRQGREYVPENPSSVRSARPAAPRRHSRFGNQGE